MIKDSLLLAWGREKCVKSPANELEKTPNEQFERGEVMTEFHETIKRKKRAKNVIYSSEQ